MRCSFCNGPLVSLGSLGNIAHFRCRNCGMDYSSETAQCGACSKTIPATEAESCWYCQGDLCPSCWDEYGHCGHEEAERFNERIRKEVQGEKTVELWSDG